MKKELLLNNTKSGKIKIFGIVTWCSVYGQIPFADLAQHCCYTY